MILLNTCATAGSFIETIFNNAVFGVLVGWGLSEFSTFRRRKTEDEKNILYTNIGNRTAAYENLFNCLVALKNYHLDFVSGTEFLRGLDGRNFSPTEAFENFEKESNLDNIWFDEETRDELVQFKKFIEHGQIIGLRKHLMNTDDQEDEECISENSDCVSVIEYPSEEAYCDAVVNEIERILQIIKRSVGADKLHKHISRGIL